jgi:quinol monooxygenase YgiN
MHGRIGKMIATSGQRDKLVEILLNASGGMPGCLSYVVASDPGDEDAIWITEVWKDEASHAAALSSPAVKAAITAGRSLIAGMEAPAVTIPVGGLGIQSPD